MACSQPSAREPSLNSTSFYNFITDDCYVPATVAVHLRRQDLASRNRVFSYLWCFDVENLEVGGRLDWISHRKTITEDLAFNYSSTTLAVLATRVKGRNRDPRYLRNCFRANGMKKVQLEAIEKKV